jgi:hypothetical protein
MPSCLYAQEPDIEMGGSADFLMESTPMKPHENVYIEDVEAQVKEAHDEAKSVAKEIKNTELMIKKVRKKNYGDKKNLQKDTLDSLERKKKADTARLKVWIQREKLQKEILAFEKRRARAKVRAQKAEDSVVAAKDKLHDSRQTRMSVGNNHRAPPTNTKKYRRVRVNLGDESRSKKGVADAY